jgi:hypothetical protein
MLMSKAELDFTTDSSYHSLRHQFVLSNILHPSDFFEQRRTMNSSRVFLSRNAWRLGFSSTKQQKFAANDLSISIVALTTANLAYYCLSKHGDDDDQRMSFRGNEWSALLSSMKRKDDLVTECREEALVGVGNECPSGYSESKRFFQVLAYHRELLADYQRRWPEAHEGKSPRKMKRDWPRRIPKAHQIASLEFDLRFCERSEGGDTKKCQDLKFRIACFYIYHESNPVFQKKGLHLVKELANKGHPDGMCLYGTFDRFEFHFPSLLSTNL